MMTHLHLLLLFLLYISPPSSASWSSTNNEEQIDNLKRIAYTNPEGSQPFVSAWQQILALDPTNLEAHVMLGWSLMSTPPHQEAGIQLLEASFDPDKVSPTIHYGFPQTYMIAATIGRYRSEKKEYTAAKKFTQLALELSGRQASTTQSEVTCLQMQLASMFDYFPKSEDDADAVLDSMATYANRLLNNESDKDDEYQNGWNNDNKEHSWPIRDQDIVKFPGAAPDPYIHCELSVFPLSFYYRADVAAVASRHYEMALRGWPALGTIAKFVQQYDDVDAKGGEHPCIDRKIRLAVISGVLTEGHSNSESFGGVLSHLDRNMFDVTYVLLTEQGDPEVAKFTKAHSSDRVYVWGKEDGDASNGAWVTRWGKEIESWEMDIIFHFDLTMSTFARRLGMMRLAPVQVTSNGHPITSGHDKSVIQYYISWAAAELPPEESQKHYTEDLKLIPSDIAYQYYERRILPGQISRMDGQSFRQLQRTDFGLPQNKHYYLCMQKPHKFHPEFDTLLCGIMVNDKEGLVVLHREVSPSNQNVFEKRLERAGCDLSRITFLDQQPHHRLLALYRESTVVLDSYPAGGDTTTREVIEMGKPLVTLPARLLGGRWSLGYLNNIGLKESTKQALIATNPEEYINLAVNLANDDTFRKSVEADITAAAPNLFHRVEAVVAWQEMFLEISPYQQCQTHTLTLTRKIQKGEL